MFNFRGVFKNPRGKDTHYHKGVHCFNGLLLHTVAEKVLEMHALNLVIQHY